MLYPGAFLLEWNPCILNMWNVQHFAVPSNEILIWYRFLQAVRDFQAQKFHRLKSIPVRRNMASKNQYHLHDHLERKKSIQAQQKLIWGWRYWCPRMEKRRLGSDQQRDPHVCHWWRTYHLHCRLKFQDSARKNYFGQERTKGLQHQWTRIRCGKR